MGEKYYSISTCHNHICHIFTDCLIGNLRVVTNNNFINFTVRVIIINVFKNSNARPLYRDTVPLKAV